MAEFRESQNDVSTNQELASDDVENLDFSPKKENVFEEASSLPKMSKRRRLEPERWIQVQNVVYERDKWHPSTDKLAGTSVYGTAYDDRSNWSVKFSHLTYNQFLFVSGDRSVWLIASKDSVSGSFYSGPRTIVRSSQYRTA